jgi:hypothetical protein
MLMRFFEATPGRVSAVSATVWKNDADHAHDHV